MALVTGAGRGIGRTTATRFAREGARVHLAVSRRRLSGKELSVRDGGGALSEEQFERLARYFYEEVVSSPRHRTT